MSKDVLIGEQTYSGITDVQLKTTTGQAATFKDVDEIVTPSGEKEITANGTYDITGYASVVVNIPTEGEAMTINTEASTTFELANGTEFRRGEVAELVLTIPEELPTAFSCQVAFTSGENATSITMPTDVVMQGESVSNGVFTPKAHYRYGLMFWYDGEIVWCVICAAALEGAEDNPDEGGSGDNTGDDTGDTGNTGGSGSGGEDDNTEMTGSGTESDPYMIATAAQFVALGEEVDAGDTKSGVYYAVANDLDLDGIEWNPIGANYKNTNSDTDNSGSFAGTIDGRGHVIRNISINGMQYAGLFGSNFAGTVMNLGLEGGSISTTYASSTCGAIARKGSGKIVNCYARVPGQAVTRSSGIIDEIEAGGMVLGCYQAAAINNGNGYAIKSATTTTGTIKYCLWDSTLTEKGIAGTSSSDSNNNGITTAEFATAHTTLNNNLSAVAAAAGIDVAKLCAWEAGSDGYPRLVVA